MFVFLSMAKTQKNRCFEINWKWYNIKKLNRVIQRWLGGTHSMDQVNVNSNRNKANLSKYIILVQWQNWSKKKKKFNDE